MSFNKGWWIRYGLSSDEEIMAIWNLLKRPKAQTTTAPQNDRFLAIRILRLYMDNTP